MTDTVSTSPEGDTLDAIRARHFEQADPSGRLDPWCHGCMHIWACDTAIVLAALDESQAVLDINLGVATEREARLRAALNAIANNVLTDPRAAARAALATEAEPRRNTPPSFGQQQAAIGPIDHDIATEAEQ